MARVRVVVDRNAIRELMKTDLVTGRAAAVADACNAQSSWGGYASTTESDEVRARARVWSYASQDGGGNTERANRMIRNLDAGG